MSLPADGVFALTCGLDVGVPAVEDVFDGELPVEDVPFTPAGEVELLVVVLLFEIEVLLDVEIPTLIGVFSADVLAAA